MNIVMSSILAESLLLATSGLLSIGSITLTILLLISERGKQNGLGYALGYFISYVLIGILFVFLRYAFLGGTSDEESSSGLNIFFIVFGAILIAIALKKSFEKPEQTSDKKDLEKPKFIAFLDNVTPKKAFGFGLLVPIINFKNLGLFFSAMSPIVFSSIMLSEKISFTILVSFVFCLSVFLPVLLYYTFPKRGEQILTKFKKFLSDHGRIILICLLFLFGVLFITKGALNL